MLYFLVYTQTRLSILLTKYKLFFTFFGLNSFVKLTAIWYLCSDTGGEKIIFEDAGSSPKSVSHAEAIPILQKRELEPMKVFILSINAVQNGFIVNALVIFRFTEHCHFNINYIVTC